MRGFFETSQLICRGWDAVTTFAAIGGVGEHSLAV